MLENGIAEVPERGMNEIQIPLFDILELYSNDCLIWTTQRSMQESGFPIHNVWEKANVSLRRLNATEWEEVTVRVRLCVAVFRRHLKVIVDAI